jgi:rabenosyn-5
MAELEGFICPLCMMSLPGVSLLEKHVRENHDDTATGKMKANFKQFIDKAKSSLSKGKLAQDGPVSEGAAAVGHASDGSDDGDHHLINTSGINPLLWPEQEFGCNRDHMQRFRSKRDAKVQRIVVETNRLLVRLEKLLKLLKNQHTMKPKQLKTLEQEIVPWKKDSDQKRCMKCLREFNLRRRKHHCRLCGDIICKSCSSFFPLSEACELQLSCG